MEQLDRAGELFRQHGAKFYLDQVITKKLEIQGVSSLDTRTSIDAVASFVQREKPDLRSHAAPDGTVTLLFTDIVDSTPLNERLGDERWMELLREHNAIVRRHIVAHEGYEVKTEGDGFMVAFGSARRALQCAIEIQRSFAARNASAAETVDVRAGLHTGEVIQDAGDFYGKHVNLAARIMKAARGSEILVSSLLRELAAGGGEITFGDPRDMDLKGIAETQRVFAVAWQTKDVNRASRLGGVDRCRPARECHLPLSRLITLPRHSPHHSRRAGRPRHDGERRWSGGGRKLIDYRWVE